MSTVTFDLPARTKIKNKVSGLEGVVSCRVERINGAKQYLLDPPRDKEGKEVRSEYCDIEDIEVLDHSKKIKKETVDFLYETGDKVLNRVNGKQGIIITRRIDPNRCIGYWFETGEQNPKDGDILAFYAFEQELELIDRGLNAPKQKPVKRASTGCVNAEAPPK